MKNIGVRYPVYRLITLAILSGSHLVLNSSDSFADTRVQDSSAERLWLQWQTVGFSTLKWGFWDIYHARLKTSDGQYDGDDPYAREMALIIDYRWNIRKSRLLSVTDEQWRHLGVSRSLREQWIQRLAALWKNVRIGDQLAYVLTDSTGKFYFGDAFLGQIDDVQLARAFIDIWLSERTAYPDLRRQLIGWR